MTAKTVIRFGEVNATMTFAEGMAFTERTRRQLERFDVLPHTEGSAIDPIEAAAILRLCDELEADMSRSLSKV